MKKFGPLEVTTPGDTTIFLRRRYPVEAGVLFDAWTQARHLEHWWDPRGRQLALCEIDLRPGGRFRFVHDGGDGAGHAFEGTYVEIKRPERLVFETISPPSVGTLTFEPTSDSETQLTMTIECGSKAQRDGMVSHGVVEGTADTLENLARYLAGTERH